MATYNGWEIVAMPTDPPAPASFEFARNAIVGAVTNPFTGQQQIHDWGATYLEASVSYASMPKAQAQPWVAFIKDLAGPTKVFQFPAAICAAFPAELTSDGTTPRYWRLKNSPVKWSVRLGPFYSLTFEIREAL